MPTRRGFGATLVGFALTIGPASAASAQSPPRVDAVKVVGAERTSASVVVDLTRLSAEEPLTVRAWMLAERRLRQLPIARDASLRFVPVKGTRAEMQAIIHEKSLLPLDAMDWGGVATRAILKDEIKIDLGGPAGRGEVWSAAWRWSENRPRVMLGVAAIQPAGKLAEALGRAAVDPSRRNDATRIAAGRRISAAAASISVIAPA